MRIKFRMLLAIIAILILIGSSSALEEILDSFNAKYNTRNTRLDTCDTCHISGKKFDFCDVCHYYDKPVKYDSLNSYGKDLKNNLNKPISQALETIENIDSDKDKFSNIDEIHNLTFPGDKNDFPRGKPN